MSTIRDLRSVLQGEGCKVIIAGDGQTRSHTSRRGRIVEKVPVGGVSVGMDRVSQGLNAIYVGRARSEEDVRVLDPTCKVCASGRDGTYTLKRVSLSDEELNDYYNGFSNQTLWPLFHAAYQKPIFNEKWFDGYRSVSRKFAEAIEAEIDGPTLVWLNDYQLALAPSFLKRNDDTSIAFFWHIPWPCWQIFRILPWKRQILESLLACDFIAFHTAYQTSNFLQAVRNELKLPVDDRLGTIRYDGRTVRVAALPMGIDADIIRAAAATAIEQPLTNGPKLDRTEVKKRELLEKLCSEYKVILGVDRLDYTKGILERLRGLDKLFRDHPEYIAKVVYVGIMSPTRTAIPAYQRLRAMVRGLERKFNREFGTAGWRPLHMFYDGRPREEVLRLYGCADVCLVTSIDDGMNLVAKEFVVATSCAPEPGILVLSEFAGAAQELTSAILVNPYGPENVAAAVHDALEMPADERKRRVEGMAAQLEEHNVYAWATRFMREALDAARPTFDQVA